MSSYKVGQVLFLILAGKTSVVPLQVVKEVTEKTLDGEITSYMVCLGSEPNKTVNLSSVNGEVFTSSDKVKAVLLERVTETITQIIDGAVSKSKEWYPTGFEEADVDSLALITKQVPVMADVVTSAAAPVQQRRRRASREVAETAAELAREAEAAFIELPDGSKARVGKVIASPTVQG